MQEDSRNGSPYTSIDLKVTKIHSSFKTSQPNPGQAADQFSSIKLKQEKIKQISQQ